MAYNQLELDEESSKMAAWSTMRGVFRVDRLAFGIKTATGIFQRTMEKLLQGISGVFVFIDDIVITGSTRQDYLSNIVKVFERLQNAGLRLKKDKCKFFQPEIKYLGHIVNKDGISKSKERVEAVINSPIPTSVTEVRAFAGLVNYYGKYMRNLSTTMAPIYKLLRKDVAFCWDDECSESFRKIKREIAEEVTLAHFNQNLPIILETDASDKGIGGVISHKMPDDNERPVAFFSRTLTKAELNYPVIQKEALAIVEAWRKFFDYLIGIRFTLRTDHKPLVSIFGDKKRIPSIAAARMQRWAHYLSAFDFKIEHKSGTENGAADALSRLLAVKCMDEIAEVNYLKFINGRGVTLDHATIKKETARDAVVSKVFEAINSGTVNQLKGDDYKPYIQRSEELTTEGGIVMWGYRVIIPPKLRADAVKNIHVSHLGIAKCQSIARMCMWWPRMDADIETFIKACEHCAMQRPDPPKSELISWQNAGQPWSRIHVDYAGPMDKEYFLIVTDSFSKWPEVFRTRTITAEFTIRKIDELFARFGIPHVVVSDAGTQFTSDAFKNFMELNGRSTRTSGFQRSS